MIVVDTGPLVAAAISTDTNHRRCVELFASLHLNGERLVVPAFVVTEACYLLGARGWAEAGGRLRPLAGGR